MNDPSPDGPPHIDPTVLPSNCLSFLYLALQIDIRRLRHETSQARAEHAREATQRCLERAETEEAAVLVDLLHQVEEEAAAEPDRFLN